MMDKSNLELFKQALYEGLSNRFDDVASSYTGEIVCSKKHELAMRAIVYGKVSSKATLSPKMRRIVAILIAAALLLTSCGIIFRNELKEFFREFYVMITLSDNVSGEDFIEEVYELTYVPEGYYLETESFLPLETFYQFVNENGNMICFEQYLLEGTTFIMNSESGYSKMFDVSQYDIYFRDTTHSRNYLWTDNKYALSITTNAELDIDELLAIIDGLTIK